MRNAIFIFCLLLGFSLSATAQKTNKIQLSQEITTESYSVSDFSELDIASDFTTYITFGQTASLEIKANENMHDHIMVEQKGDRLFIKEKNNLWLKGKQILVAYLTVPTLNYIKGSEDAIIVLENELVANSLELILNEDSSLEGDLSLQELKILLKEDSYATIHGSARKVSGKLKEDSEFKSFDFVIGDLNLTLQEDSMAALTVNGDMVVNMLEDSEMQYKGEPNIKRQIVLGDSELRKAW